MSIKLHYVNGDRLFDGDNEFCTQSAHQTIHFHRHNVNGDGHGDGDGTCKQAFTEIGKFEYHVVTIRLDVVVTVGVESCLSCNWSQR